MTAATVALAAALAACGAGTPPGAEPETLDKAEFVRRADAICTDIRRRLRPLVKARTKAFIAIWRRANARARLHGEKLILVRDLDEPDRDADLLDRSLRDTEAVAVAERGIASAAVTRDLDLVRRQEKERDEAARREAASASAFGFDVCGTETVGR